MCPRPSVPPADTSKVLCIVGTAAAVIASDLRVWTERVRHARRRVRREYLGGRDAQFDPVLEFRQHVKLIRTFAAPQCCIPGAR